MSSLLDLSHLIEDGMPVYPGDTATRLVQVKSITEDYYNNHRLEIAMHAGTHIDSPMHLTECKEYISTAPLEAFVGPGCILDVRDQRIILPKPEYVEQVKDKSLLLLCTGQDKLYGTEDYYQDYPCVSMDFCDFILSKQIKMVGMDSPSPDKIPFDIHKKLLSNGVYIMENMTNLDKLLGAGEFELVALPLKIRADGSPTRAIAKIL